MQRKSNRDSRELKVGKGIVVACFSSDLMDSKELPEPRWELVNVIALRKGSEGGWMFG